MSEFDGGRAKAWNVVYNNLNPSPSQAAVNKAQGPWKDFGSSVNAISFGFVATAILISMFLIMAIFEHLFRPNAPDHNAMGSSQIHKLGTTPSAMQMSPQPSAFSVVMPGQRHPTFLAQPAPLPCPREGVRWPSHDRRAVTFV
ncbi:uncharacterized protein LOC127255666 [Andrographis paniculata]|uniref:uncharacterized protein LOC127255666 n=1 Tax=Andrographis paniculata TaxID=175694 RepID=UPI0021E9687B|nr:uncharacterized protein LOC127255666 [Andrographis paniculata]